MRPRAQTTAKLKKLRRVLRGAQSSLIVLQDNPDPDAIASAAALAELVRRTSAARVSIAYGGTVGRAENRELVRYLAIGLAPAEETDFGASDVVALVDTQPGTGNNALPPDVRADIVIDHHPRTPLSRRTAFCDIRPRYGATATILAQYLFQSRYKPDTRLATALAYAIRSDTQDLGRDTTQADIDAYVALYTLANKRVLARIEHASLPHSYFGALAEALDAAEISGRALYAFLREGFHPDILAEAADLLLRCEGVSWVLCVGHYEGMMYLSLRAGGDDRDAGEVIRRVVGGIGRGGGHNTTAGGHIRLTIDCAAERAHVANVIRKRFLKAVECNREPAVALLQQQDKAELPE